MPIQAAVIPPTEDRPAPAAPVNAASLAATPLAVDDTRWAKTTPQKADAAIADAGTAPDPAERPQGVATGPDERAPGAAVNEAASAAEAAGQAASEPVPDDAATASIPAGTGDVQVAVGEAEVAKLEAATGMIEDSPAAEDTSSAPLPALTTAHVTKYVNLRNGPADEARVIAVIPANAEIKVESRCQWCTVVYKGQRGYIYKSFIRRGLKEAAAEGTGLF